MPGGTGIRNEIGLRRVQAGTEAVPGTAVAADHRWLGNFVANKSAALVRTPEMTGTYDGLITPRKELATFDGSYSELLTYQGFVIHNQYGIKAGATGTVAGAGWSYTASPSAAEDDIASATVEYGVDGQVWRSTGVRHNEYTITIDTDDADGVWKLSANEFIRDKTQVVGDSGTVTAGTTSTLTDSSKAWTVNQWAGYWCFIRFGTGAGEVRQITSNTATALTFYAPVLAAAPTAGQLYRIEGIFTAGVPFPSYDSIAVPGTKLFIDPVGGTIGTTQLLDRMVSYNITVNNARTSKRFAENSNALSARTGRGQRLITGQVRLEFDRRDEYNNFENLAEVMIRVRQEGPALSATPGDVQYAQIDVNRAVWDVVDLNERENNITATFGFVAYVPASGAIATFSGKTDLSVLP